MDIYDGYVTRLDEIMDCGQCRERNAPVFATALKHPSDGVCFYKLTARSQEYRALGMVSVSGVR